MKAGAVMDVMQKIRRNYVGVYDRLLSGIKLKPDLERQLTIKHYQKILMEDRKLIFRVVEEAKTASLGERALIAYVLTICDFAHVAHSINSETLLAINFLSDSVIMIIVELLCYHRQDINPRLY